MEDYRDSPKKDFFRNSPQLATAAPTIKVKKREIVAVTDLLDPPNREKRPPKICVILRGPPGSGKTYIAKLIKVSGGFSSLQNYVKPTALYSAICKFTSG